MKYDEEKARYDQQVQEFENLRSQKLQAEQQRLDEFTQDQARLLSQRIPEIADPKKGDAIKRGLVEAGTHYGFSEAELGKCQRS